MDFPIVHHITVSHVEPIHSCEHVLEPDVPIVRRSRWVRRPSRIAIVVSVSQNDYGSDVMCVQIGDDGRRSDRWNTSACAPTIVASCRRVGENIVVKSPVNYSRISLNLSNRRRTVG